MIFHDHTLTVDSAPCHAFVVPIFETSQGECCYKEAIQAYTAGVLQ